VSDVVTVVATGTGTGTGTDASAQLQQYESVLQHGVDIVVHQPHAADAFVDAVDAAAAEGIPSVAVQTNVPSDNSVNVVCNDYASTISTANQVLQNIGGVGYPFEIDDLVARHRPAPGRRRGTCAWRVGAGRGVRPRHLRTDERDAERMTAAEVGYDRSGLTTGIVHFGVGNFHRSHQAKYIDSLLRQGLGAE
jgi:hypothetical protein